MKRRTFVQWLSVSFGAACAAMIAVPGVGYLAGMLGRSDDDKAVVRRIARLADLPKGRPVMMPVLGTRRDAWTQYAQQPVGRVWLVRRTDDSTPASDEKVDAYTSICPHLGCTIQVDQDARSFVCPCHRAKFDGNGQRTTDAEPGYTNHSPRDMDSIDCRLVKDDEFGDWWVEIRYEEFKAGLTKKVPVA